MTRIVTSAIIALCLLGIGNAMGQAYPSKSIRLIAPYPPGGGIDATARIIAQALTAQLGQQVVVENRSGATGRIGTEIAAKAPRDGYTLLLGSGAPNAVVPSVTPNLPYDPIKDFAPISLVGVTDYTLVIHPSVPVHSVKQLVALAKARPGELTYGSSGILSNTHLAGELLKQMANVSIVHVAYKGTGPAMVAVLTGEMAISFGGGPAAAPHVKANRLRALATTGSRRRDPQVPTLGETLPGYEVNQWYGILAPAGTPQAVLDRLHKEVTRAVTSRTVADRLTNLGADPVTNTPAEFLDMIKSEIVKWRKVITTAKISVK
ncbi:MAG TPA: tripartite tricarboxylate transporter substrate binding protein [Burkholderiales bacterium]|jgi:tripartite-type tricarboxylate transporter receptor subunit TctC|nr:tripartite tricarboxylate transporter substrate binding protein [Burkholderiales bacterium]